VHELPMAPARGRVRAAHIARIVLVTVLGALVVLCVLAVATGRYQVRPVLSGSMEPGLPVGGIVITERVPMADVHVRDVVVFHRPDHPDELVVHRIIALNPSADGPIIQTQGDANTIADPWKVTMRGDTAYRAVFTLPVIGYAAVWVHGPTGRLALTVLGVILILGAVAAGVFRRLRTTAKGGDESERREVLAANGNTPSPAADACADPGR
jgi:signal peptidase